MIDPKIIQQTPEWFQAKAGMISASKMCEMMAEGNGLTREKYRTRLAIERLIGKPLTDNGFTTKDIERGNELEPEAREYYEFYSGSTVTQVPFIYHEELDIGLASPDALVDDDGLLEIKCPSYAVHVKYLRTKKIPRAYLLQIFWQLACTGRQFCDWMSYCPELPPNARALIIRVPRDDEEIQVLERETRRFNKEIDELKLFLESYR